jgi:uncharacterized protein HemY
MGMLRLIKRLSGIGIGIVVLVAVWAGYDMVASSGMVDVPKIDTPDTAGVMAHVTQYGIVIVIAVVVILVLRVVLRRRSNTHVGYTRWRD